jgi:hypothetical protein
LVTAVYDLGKAARQILVAPQSFLPTVAPA